MTITKGQAKIIKMFMVNDIDFVFTGSKIEDFGREGKDLDIVIADSDYKFAESIIPNVSSASTSIMTDQNDKRLYQRENLIDFLFVKQERYDVIKMNSNLRTVKVEDTEVTFEAYGSSTYHIIEAKLQFLTRDVKLTTAQQKHYHDILYLFL
jgi:hypothetical protein